MFFWNGIMRLDLPDFSYGATFGYGRVQKNWFRSVSIILLQLRSDHK